MPLVPVENVGQVGIVRDTPPYALPPNAWSGGNNVRFLDNGVKKMEGYIEVLKTCPFEPYYIHPYLAANGTYYWLAYGATDIAVWSGSVWDIVTRQTTLQLNGVVTAGDNFITLDDASALPASGTVEIGTNISSDAGVNEYEELVYTSRTGTVLNLSGTAQYDHPDNAVVTPVGSTKTTDNPYNANTTSNRWIATNLNGLVVATNGVDPPQMWPLDNGIPNPNTPFRALRNFPTARNESCKSIQSFRTFLVGLNWGRDNEEPRIVKWSTEAAYGQEPFTWDETDATLDAGEYELSDTPGDIIDGRPLGDSFLIYKDDSIYIMNFIGTPYIFAFKLLSPNIGALAKNCIAEYENGHFFIGNSDCYITNGQQVTALLPDRMRRAMFDNFKDDAGTYEKAFVVADHMRNEMLACYPADESTVVNRALVWNWKNNTFSFRDLPTTSHISYGIVEIAEGATWDTQSDYWDIGVGVWGGRNYDTVRKQLVFADVNNTKIFRDGYGNKEDTENMYSYIERTGYDLGNAQNVKFVSAVYPQMEVSGDNTVKVYVGRQMAPEDAITWEGPVLFNPNRQSKVSCRVSGKYFAFKVESDTDVDWRLHGVHFELQERGTRGIRAY